MNKILHVSNMADVQYPDRDPKTLPGFQVSVGRAGRASRAVCWKPLGTPQKRAGQVLPGAAISF